MNKDFIISFPLSQICSIAREEFILAGYLILSKNRLSSVWLLKKR